MSSAYRSAYEHIVGLKETETREAREAIAPMMPELRAINQARLGRIVAGLVGAAGAGAMVWSAATREDEMATYSLVGGVVAFATAWVVARCGLHVAGKLGRHTSEPKLTGELDADVALLEKNDVRHELRAIEKSADKLETASVALPIAGLTFLLPLFLHWVFACVFGRENAHDYSTWIRVSLIIVGHAHIALAVLGYLFARKLHRSDVESIQKLRIHREWAKIWGITIGVSCLPGIILILVPPLLVAVTGIAFIPFMILGLRNAVLNERMALARAHEAVGLPFQEGKWMYIPPDTKKGLPEIEAPHPRTGPEGPREGARFEPRTYVATGATTFGGPAMLSTEEEQRETYRDDEHAGADAGDRAQA